MADEYRNVRTRWGVRDYREKPREFDPALADVVIDRVGNGELLPAICCDPDLPLPGVFLEWCEQDPSLEERYRRARLRGADVNFDEAVIAAHDPDASRAGTRSRALMWHTERAAPERYAPRTMNRTPKDKEDDAAGFDYSAEVRRKLQSMADREDLRRRTEGSGDGEGAPDPAT